MSIVESIWFGDGAADGVVRGFLAPASWVYAGAMAARNALYDAGGLHTRPASIPCLSVGNLSVGGTGKTPVAAWTVQQLRASGAAPAVVLRGYGDDEPLVHERLNPGVHVVADADRVRGVAAARGLGADCAILDDAFQHRRIARVADWVLVSAEQWRPGARTLPAGPLREPLAALRRADLVVVTRKSASVDRAAEVTSALARFTSDNGPALALFHLAADALVDAATGERRDLQWLRGRAVVAVAAVGVPGAFFGQLEAAGARVTPVAYRDHHAFDAADVAHLTRLAGEREAIVCTLKDAVKLAPRWPRAGPPLWYVSQRVVVERGGAAVDASLALVLAARQGVSPTAGPAGQSSSPHGHRSPTADE